MFVTVDSATAARELSVDELILVCFYIALVAGLEVLLALGVCPVGTTMLLLLLLLLAALELSPFLLFLLLLLVLPEAVSLRSLCHTRSDKTLLQQP